MVIKEIEVKDIMTKTNLPVSHYAVNPYVGCTHACKYCCASFMKRFTNHPEPWGEFVDVKSWPENLNLRGDYKKRIGACWVHIRNRTGKRKTSDEEIRELLGVPGNYAVLNLVALGGKGEQKRGYTEADLDKGKVHMERY